MVTPSTRQLVTDIRQCPSKRCGVTCAQEMQQRHHASTPPRNPADSPTSDHASVQVTGNTKHQVVVVGHHAHMLSKLSTCSEPCKSSCSEPCRSFHLDPCVFACLEPASFPAQIPAVSPSLGPGNCPRLICIKLDHLTDLQSDSPSCFPIRNPANLATRKPAHSPTQSHADSTTTKTTDSPRQEPQRMLSQPPGGVGNG